MIAAVRAKTRGRFATIPEALLHWAQSQPGELAITAGTEELSYGELMSLVQEAAERLRGFGLGAGGRVALLGHNSIEWTVAFFAGLRVGAIVVPLNTRLGPLELVRQLDAIDPQVILAEESLVSLGHSQTAPSRAVVTLERNGGSRALWRLPRARVTEQPPGPGDPAVIAFTSGTTGNPRGAVVHHEALVRSASAYIPHFETSSTDRTAVLVPLFHNTGFVDQLSQMALVGGSVDLLREFSVAAALEALTRRPATYLIAVPSIFRLLMLSDEADVAFRGCRVAAYGGSTMPSAWIDELAARWPHLRLFNCYGLTEFTSVTHVLGPEHAHTHYGSVGRPVRDVCQLVVDERRRELSAGQQGEIWVKGPMRMLGYWRDEAATKDKFRGKWLRTGDVGSVDEDGFLNVVGRAAEVINRGGEKIHATQVEAALSELPEIAEAAVVGTPHPVLGERVVAAIVLRAGGELDPQAVRSHLLARVADYAVPDQLFACDDLPRNAAGKLDRRRIRQEVLGLFDREAR